MKKLLNVIAFSLLLSLLLSSCANGGLAITEEPGESVETAAVSTEADSTETDSFPFVPKKTTWEMINSIPVATPEMTQDQLRQICVDFAVMQQSFEWTPTDDLHYLSSTGEDGKLHCVAGAVFGGLPYGSGGLSLYSAMDYYDESTGVLDTSTLAGKTTMPLSNHCSSSIRWAFGRISTNIKYNLTNDMIRANGCIPLGPYKYNEDIETFADLPTKTITQENGEQTMFASYALLNKADGMVTYATSYGGHTRMVIEKAVVARNADGTIDGANSYVFTVEQYSTQTNTDIDGVTVAQHGELRKKYTFNELYKSGYIPFTIPELCGLAKVERAWAKLDTDSTDYSALQNATVSSNYMIAKIIVTLFDENGNVISATTRHVPTSPTYAYSLTNLLSNRFKEDVKAADRLLIQAFVASGESLTVFDGKAA